MKLLHTSDWHLGHTLCGKKRTEEFEAFLAWLLEQIRIEGVEALLLAGDVFDTPAPGTQVQTLYYRFISRLADSPCRHVVIIAGNHDSPAFLEAPREILRALNVHVVASARDNPDDELLLLEDPHGVPELLVGAVPYLRDREVRSVAPDEAMEDKERKLLTGIRDHYARVCALAETRRAALTREIPLVVMGHLFAAGGDTVEGDGVRDLYVGSLAHVAAGIFPDTIDYLALGHLHQPQQVGGRETRRYSGAPLPMGFNEIRREKSVCLVTFQGRQASVRLLPVPLGQPMESLRGSWEEIAAGIHALAVARSRAWLEIRYEGGELLGDLRERLDEAVAHTDLEILKVSHRRIMEQALQASRPEESLQELEEGEVFQRCLEQNAVPAEQHPELLRTYAEALAALRDDDSSPPPAEG